MKLQTGFGGLSVYWFNNGGCQLCTKAFSDYLSKNSETGYRGIRITKNVLHSNCLIVNGANCLTQEDNIQIEFSKALENSSIILFGDCGMSEDNIFKKMEPAFYISDTREFIPISEIITGCPPTFDEIDRCFKKLMRIESKGHLIRNQVDTEVEPPSEATEPTQ